MKTVSSILFALVLALSAASNVQAEDITVAIVVSPNVVNLDSSGSWITVHAEIAYSAVSSASVVLNGIPVDWTKSDSRGEFVAKFAIDDVKVILTPGPVQLTLTGTTRTGQSFAGTDTILVLGGAGERTLRTKTRPSGDRHRF